MTTNRMVNYLERTDAQAERWLEERMMALEHPHVTPLTMFTICGLLALGVLGIISPAFWGAVAPVYIGTLMVIAGACFALMALEWPGALTRVMLVTVGGLGIASGILMYFSPNIGLYVFSLILGLYFLFEGVMKIFCFPRYSTFSYVMMFVSGIISAGLGIVIAWVSAIDIAWVPGFLFGIDLAIGSVAFFLTLLAANCKYRQWEKARREATANPDINPNAQQINMNQGNAGQRSAGQGSVGQGSVGQGSVGQGSVGQGNIAQGNMAQGNTAQGNTAQGSMGQGSMGQGNMGQNPNMSYSTGNTTTGSGPRRQ